MPFVTRDSLVSQAADGRRRLNSLLDAKTMVGDHLEGMYDQMEREITEAEITWQDTDQVRHEQAEQKMTDNLNGMGKCEKRLQKFLAVHDECERELAISIQRINRLVSTQQTLPTSRSAGSSECSFDVLSILSDQLRDDSPLLQQQPISPSPTMSFIQSTQTTSMMVEQQTNTQKGMDRILDQINGDESPEPADVVAETRVEYLAQASVSIVATNDCTSTSMSDNNLNGESLTHFDLDYRKRVVSAGNGDPQAFCQSSAILPASIHEGVVSNDEKQWCKCTVSHVESPSLFWIHKSNHIAEAIEDELNEELDRVKKAIPNPQVGDYCVVPSEGDGDYLRRAKILEIKENSSGTFFAKILYIDAGKVDWVVTKALLELPHKFYQYCRQAVPCALAEVTPVSDYWSDDIIDKFRTLCTGENTTQLWVARLDPGNTSPDIYTVSLSFCTREDPTARKSLAFSLILESQRKATRMDQVTPMTAFEKENGEPIGGLNPPEDIDGWRCVIRAMPTVDQQENATAIAQATANATTAVVKITATSKTAVAPSKPFCSKPNSHIASTATSNGQTPGSSTSATSSVLNSRQTDSRATRNANRVIQARVIPGTAKKIPLSDVPMYGGYFYFKVTNVVTPSKFFIKIQDSTGSNRELEQLRMDMNSFYANAANRLILTSAENQCAVVLWPIDGEQAYRRIFVQDWQCNPTPRGATVDFRVNSTVTAWFIDDGIRETLQTRDICVLDKRFGALPGQSFICKLFDCDPRDGFEWDQNSIDIFRALCKKDDLMRGSLMSAEEPYEIVIYRKDAYGTETCINKEMVDSSNARSVETW